MLVKSNWVCRAVAVTRMKELRVVNRILSSKFPTIFDLITPFKNRLKTVVVVFATLPMELHCSI